MRSLNETNGRRWTTEEYQKLIGMWLREMEPEAIAAEFKLSISGLNALVQRLRKNGIPLPIRRRGQKADRRNKPWTQEEVETLVRMRNERKTTTEIALTLERTFYGVQGMILRLRNVEDVPVVKISTGPRRLWDAQRLRDAVATRGLIAIEGGKKAA